MAPQRPRRRVLPKALHENGLSLVLFGLFAVFVVGQLVAGLQVYNEEQREHGQPLVGMLEYARGPHFVEAVTENWESEFLQMALFTLLTVFLFQKGSSESKDPDEREEVDLEPRGHIYKDTPAIVRRRGLGLMVYRNSLVLALAALFFVSFALHAVGGAALYSEEQQEHGGAAVGLGQYVLTSRFWFESFQNWQSEFLSVGVLVVLSIWPRQRGSPQSKPVHAPHGETGN